MAKIITYDLKGCSSLIPGIKNANNSVFLTHIGEIVSINNDDYRSYSVTKNVQSIFHAIKVPDVVSDVKCTITSMKYNGLEVMQTNAELTLNEAGITYVNYPYYSANNFGYTNNKANGLYFQESVTPTIYKQKKFIDFIKNIVDTHNVPVKVEYPINEWTAVDGGVNASSIAFELSSEDVFEITYMVEYNSVINEVTYFIGNGGSHATIDGVTTTPSPYYDDEYSFNSFPVNNIVSITELECCPVISIYKTDVKANVNCSDCSGITIYDTSNYINGMQGHDGIYFSNRNITVTKPNGSSYIYSTIGEVGQPLACSNDLSSGNHINELITPHYNSSNVFNMPFDDNDTDGLYTIKLCTVPLWVDTSFYDSSYNNIVVVNDVMYKQVQSSTNINPELDIDNNYWEVITESDSLGRYCKEIKVLVMCLSVEKCYKDAVIKSVCNISSNSCSEPCEDTALFKAMKLRILLDAIEYAYCSQNYTEVDKILELIKNICCCGK